MLEGIPRALVWAALGCGFTWLMTTAGSAVVFFFRSERKLMHHIFLGFAAGVMVAASVWSLLNPAIEQAAEQGVPGWVPAAGGFLLGVASSSWRSTPFLPHLHAGAEDPEGVPSGLEAHDAARLRGDPPQRPRGDVRGPPLCHGRAVRGRRGGGLPGHGRRARGGHRPPELPGGRGHLAAARPRGHEPRRRAFLAGSLSGIVEPIFGVAVVLASGWIAPYMPWLLAFAAGAMIYVVVEELIPEAHLGEHSNVGTLGFIAGFVVMMVLDVALG